MYTIVSLCHFIPAFFTFLSLQLLLKKTVLDSNYSGMADKADTPSDTFLAKHAELKETLSTLVKQHKKNVSVKRTEAQELGINLKYCKVCLCAKYSGA